MLNIMQPTSTGDKLSWKLEKDKFGFGTKVNITLKDGKKFYLSVERGIIRDIEDISKCYLDVNDNNILVIRKKSIKIFDDIACIVYIDDVTNAGRSIDVIKILHPGTSVRYMKFSEGRKSGIVIYTYRRRFNTDIIDGDNYINDDKKSAISVTYSDGESVIVGKDILNTDISRVTQSHAILTSTKINNIIYYDKVSSTDDSIFKMILDNFNLYDKNVNYKIVTNKEELNCTMMSGNYLNEIYTIQVNVSHNTCNRDIEEMILDKSNYKYRINAININSNKKKITLIVLDKKEGGI